MKLIHGSILAATACAAGAVGYHMLTSDLAQEVRDQRDAIDQVSKTTSELEGAVVEHAEDIRKGQAKDGDHDRDIAQLKVQAARLETAIADAETRLREVSRDATKERARLEEELRNLQADYDQRRQEIVTLDEKMRQQDQVNAEFDRRLRALEGEDSTPSSAP